jgi:AbiJ N-terminal domain 4
MPSFSRRNNLVPEPAPDRPGQISNRLRTLLWSDFDTACRLFYRADGYGLTVLPELSKFLEHIWSEFWAQPADEYPAFTQMMAHLKTGFLDGDWFFPFDTLELAFTLAQHVGFYRTRLRESVIRHLDQEPSAYMLIGDDFVERMNEVEAQSVEAALSSGEDAVQMHFREALKKLSDRHNPDYRNSIKESISAVESACKKLTGDHGGDLNRALQKLDKQKPFHPAFKQSLEKLYAWTSDESGIRHSIKDAPNVTKADAQFMLVACSAFVNYLFAREAEQKALET